MSFLEAVKHVFANSFDFRGRARRSEYWYFCLFNMLMSFLLGFMDGMMGTTFTTSTGAQMGIIGILFSLAVLIPSLAVSIRRLHDIGKSGWYLLVCLIPLIGGLLLLYWSVLDSEPQDNKYGPNPKVDLKRLNY